MSNYQLCDTYIDTILAIFGNNIWIDGNIDLSPHESRSLDYMIASFHEPVFAPKTKFITCRE